MNPILSVITPTGARSEAFRLCRKFVERQTLDKNLWEWIVVDDGPIPVAINPSTIPNGVHVRRTPLWKPGQNTQIQNIQEGLKVARGEWIAFIEDDDWYAPNYLESMLELLEQHDLLCIGEARAKYYNIRTRRHKIMQNEDAASLCQTVFHRSYLPFLENAIASGTVFLDKFFWASAREAGNTMLLPNSVYSVGIKGMPGREGIGCGHKKNESWPRDITGRVFEEWLGDDVKFYSCLFSHIAI